MPKVAIVTSGYPMVSETFVIRHVEFLFDGNTVIVARSFDSSFSENNKQRPIFSYSESRLVKLIRPIVNKILGRPYNSVIFGNKRGLKKFILDNEVECIIAEFGHLAGVFSDVAKEMDIPYFIYFRGSDASSGIRVKRKLKLYKSVVKSSAAVFSVSNSLLNNLKSSGVVLPKCYIIPSGVDTDLFKPSIKDPNKILYAGRFVEKKQPLFIIRSFSEIVSSFPDSKLYMIGSGPLLTEAKKLAYELGIENNIIFLGSQPHSEVASHMADTSILIQHSVTDKKGATEGLPSIIQEAMSSEVVVIGSKHAGIPEAIDDQINGFLVEEYSQEELVATVLKLFYDRSLISCIGKNARRTALEKFDRKIIIKKTESKIKLHM
ncbi:glycosyltransferase family 4 protein [Marinospirillum sp.]|uniref:glycosyltransferase family 4 protein n=1 Tax=Marinospirillum sp. TaxID=2183934 RepID=UPI00384DA4C7